ncbi:MAG: hypothetical protein BGO01_09065 [Armatimonadetes bacterium 55-13]|jgi:hypothetical protein|nr:hypothetical protein [Armatimonadota bacterium]OJU62012.1 MAG: hypothetical protein BGO01_09065 [Armatimonadetes bacterium 55-13]
MSEFNEESSHLEHEGLTIPLGRDHLPEPPDVPSMVRYLAHALPEDESIHFRAAITRIPAARKNLVQVQRILRSLQAKPCSDLVRERTRDDLTGEVARAWSDLFNRSLTAAATLRLAETRVKLEDLIERVRQDRASEAFFRSLLSGLPIPPPRHRSLAPILRGDEPTRSASIESAVSEDGDFLVRVRLTPEEASEIEGQELAVLLKVPPILVGIGRVQNGGFELRIKHAGSLLEGGAYDLSLAPAKSASPLTLYPLDADPPLEADQLPSLESPLRLQEANLVGTILLPESLRIEFSGQALGIYFSGYGHAGLQKLLEIPLSSTADRFAFQIPWLGGEEEATQVYLPLRFRLGSE